MKIVHAGHHIITPISEDGIQELKDLERVARVCYKSEDKIEEDGSSAQKLILRLITSGHEAMLEHKHLTVLFVCDRAISHELVRHRLCSFAQESQRYCNYSKDKFGNEITFVQPWWLDDEDDVGYRDWKSACAESERAYLKMLDFGYTPQQARGVLPNCVKTEIVVTANYREWRHIFKLRTAPDAHPDMQWLMNGLLRDVQKAIPIVFDDVPVKKVKR